MKKHIKINFKENRKINFNLYEKKQSLKLRFINGYFKNIYFKEYNNIFKSLFIFLFLLIFFYLNIILIEANVPPVNLWGNTDCNKIYLFYNNSRINAKIYQLKAYDLFIPSDDPDTKQIEGFKMNELIDIKCDNYSFFIKFPKYGSVFRFDLYKHKINGTLNQTKKIINLNNDFTNKTNEESLDIKVNINLNNKKNSEIKPLTYVQFKPPMNLWGFTYINNKITPNITFKVICDNKTQYYKSNELGFFNVNVFCNESYFVGIDKLKLVDFISGKSLFINLSDYSKEYKRVNAIDFKNRIKLFINKSQKDMNQNDKQRYETLNSIKANDNSKTNIWIILDLSLFFILILILKLKIW